MNEKELNKLVQIYSMIRSTELRESGLKKIRSFGSESKKNALAALKSIDKHYQLRNFATKSKENANLVLELISKSGIKKDSKIKQLIEESNKTLSILKYDVELSNASAEQFFKSVFGKFGKKLAIDGYSPDQEKIKEITGDWQEENLCRFVLKSEYFEQNHYYLGTSRLVLYGSEKKGCFLYLAAPIQTSAGAMGGASDNDLTVGGFDFWFTKNLKPEACLVCIVSADSPPKYKTFLLTKDKKVIRMFEDRYIKNTKK